MPDYTWFLNSNRQYRDQNLTNVNTKDFYSSSGCYSERTLRKYRGRRAGIAVLARKLHETREIPVWSTTPREDAELTSKQYMKRRSCDHNNLIQIKPSSSNEAKKINFGLWNAQSMCNKPSEICDLVMSKHIDILAITETWLNGTCRDNRTLAEISQTLQCFKLLQVPRISRSGGGVAILLHEQCKAKQNHSNDFKSFEYLYATITLNELYLGLVVIYKPPPSKKNKVPLSTFFEEFSTLLETLNTSPENHLIITGDFNLHVDDSNNSNVIRFHDILHSANFKQHVNVPTHRHGHTLDLIITRQEDNLISFLETSCDLSSDHFAVTCNLDLQLPLPQKKFVSYRKIDDINLLDFKSQIKSTKLLLEPCHNIHDLVNNYSCTLINLLDTNAPRKSRFITSRPHAPWYSETLREMKRLKRSSERKWRSSKLEIHKQIYQQHCQEYRLLLNDAKSAHYKKVISETNGTNLFKIIDKMFKVSSTPVLPSHECSESLANDFITYFVGKIDKLHSELLKQQTSKADQAQESKSSSLTSAKFHEFHPVTADCINKLIMKSPNKSSLLDPIPTALLKDCLDVLLPTVTNIINSSLATGEVPTPFKTAAIFPKLKKASLDPDDLKNYRPISNIQFTAKILERVASNQVLKHLDDNNLLSKRQSAYRKHHSTETALLRVQNDILMALDSRQEVLLVMLDLTAAFDTIDHKIMLERLESCYGITDTALQWFNSYLNERTQFVVINQSKSTSHFMKSGVPQGSVLGPILFSLYIAPLEDVISRHGLECMFYADDSQLFVMFHPSEKNKSIDTMQSCATDIMNWNRNNKLITNESKTEILHISSKFSKSPAITHLNIGNTTIKLSPKATNLGVIFETNFSMKSQINSICSKASFALRRIGQIRKYLDEKTTERLIHAFIISHLDYCNGLLYGTPSSDLLRLQTVQNTAARLTTLKKKSEHITPTLKKLHWLPVILRIKFKILLTIYKIINGLAPSFLTDLLQIQTEERNLRSSTTTKLYTPRSRTITYGERAFAICAPKMWRSLPQDIRSADSINIFKKKLKTHLFTTFNEVSSVSELYTKF